VPKAAKSRACAIKAAIANRDRSGDDRGNGQNNNQQQGKQNTPNTATARAAANTEMSANLA